METTKMRRNRCGQFTTAGINKLVVLLFAVAMGGCAPGTFKVLGVNVDNVAQLMKSPPKPPTPTGAGATPDVAMELPMVKARFCLGRAIDHYEASRLSTGFDMTMLILAGAAAGTGTSMGAATSAMDDSGTRQDVAIASVTLLAAGGAMLALRTALGLDEIGRTQRIAAARNVEAAIAILEAYALAEDPAEVEVDGFATCRDGDIEIAKRFPGPKSNEAIERLIINAEEAEKSAEASAVDAKADIQKAQQQKAQAQKKVVALTAERTTAKQRGLTTKAATLNSEIVEATEAQNEKDAEVAAAKRKLVEANLAAAKAELAAARATVLRAGARLRRAVFFLTNTDVALAQQALQGAALEVASAQARVADAGAALKALESD